MFIRSADFQIVTVPEFIERCREERAALVKTVEALKATMSVALPGDSTRIQINAATAQRIRNLQLSIAEFEMIIVEAERIRFTGFDHAERNAGWQFGIREILLARQLQRGVVRRVQHFPRQVRAMVPNPGAPGDGADVRPN